MGFMKFALVTMVLVLAISIYFGMKFQMPKEVPKLTLKYWGPGKEKIDNKAIRPFKISVPSSTLKRLMMKLDLTEELPSPLEGIAFQYGMNNNYLNDFLHFWKTKYNWTEREAYLNSFPQFTTQIGGLNIHFLHEKPDPIQAKGKNVLPLIILHGWPGAVNEFFHLIPMLTTPRRDSDFVFEVVIPSLPGFTFSQGSSVPGLGTAEMAVMFDELMTRLGHHKYYVHGEDWGSVIGNIMAILNPDKVLGYHSTFCMASTLQSRIRSVMAILFPNFFVEESMQEEYFKKIQEFFTTEGGYLHLQATKPDAAGVAASDSPIGLASCFLEKFSTWTNRTWKSLPDGGLDNFNKEELLDHIMIYWFTKSIITSMRLYKEHFSSTNKIIQRYMNTVPTACAWFKYELLYHPKFVLESSYQNLVQISHFEKGGHFSAYEEPKLVADDIWKFVKTITTNNK